MRRLLMVLFLFPIFRCYSQDVQSLLREGRRLDASFKEDQALRVYKEALGLQPHNIAALCACSELSCRIGNREGTREKKLSYFKAGLTYANAAFLADSLNSEANVAMAFSTGRIILLESGREKVSGAGAIKRYAEQAIRLDPRNYKAWHILGRWNYEVSNLNIFERTLARWFYGALPAASLKDAITDYEKSMALRPAFMLNYLELARACYRDGQIPRAIGLLKQIDHLKDEMYDDRTVRREASRLLAEWQ
jgi:tetratricopeptide (TPR) repeat protein